MTTLYIILALSPIIYLIIVLLSRKKTANKVYQIKELILSHFSKEYKILFLINQERRKLAIQILKLDQLSTNLAKQRVTEMLNNQELSHTLMQDERALLINSGADKVRENIAYGYTNIEALHSAFIKSENHYKNIISKDHDWCGIAIKEKYYCILFGGDNSL